MGLNDMSEMRSKLTPNTTRSKANWESIFDPKQDEIIYFNCTPGGEIGWFHEHYPSHPISSFMKMNSAILSNEIRNVVFEKMYNKCLNKYHFHETVNHAADKLTMYVAGYTTGQTYKLESLINELMESKKLHLKTQDHINQCIKSNCENADSVKAQTDATVKALTKLVERVEKYNDDDYGDPDVI